MAPALRISADNDSGSAVAISRCSGAKRSASAGASPRFSTTMTATKLSPLAPAVPRPHGGAEALPAPPRHARARERRELSFDGGRDGAAEVSIVGDQDRLRRCVVLGLGEEIGGDPGGIVVLVGDDHHL